MLHIITSTGDGLLDVSSSSIAIANELNSVVLYRNHNIMNVWWTLQLRSGAVGNADERNAVQRTGRSPGHLRRGI